jgi:hypothetical protein
VLPYASRFLPLSQGRIVAGFSRGEIWKLLNLADDRKLPALDALRGIAILLVIVSHFFPGNVPYAVVISLYCGKCGVILFFFLSGFLMDRTLDS